MEVFRFTVFHDKTSIEENFGHNVVTTKKKERRKRIALLL